MNIIKKIIKDKASSIPTVSAIAKFPEINPIKDFLSAIKRKSKHPSLVGELKRSSPSKGEINKDMTVEKALTFYGQFASAMSILTESNYFGGSINDLYEASLKSKIPLLRKDFLTQPIQVKEARHYGADAYLLITGALEKNQLAELIEAGAEFSMPALIEVHNEAELEIALQLPIKILGINNRNLTDLSIDLSTTDNLLGKIPVGMKSNLVIISESGYSNTEQISAINTDVDALLIGTSIMSAKNPQQFLRQLFHNDET